MRIVKGANSITPSKSFQSLPKSHTGPQMLGGLEGRRGAMTPSNNSLPKHPIIYLYYNVVLTTGTTQTHNQISTATLELHLIFSPNL